MGYWKKMRDELDSKHLHLGEVLMGEDEKTGFIIIEGQTDEGIMVDVSTVVFVGDIGTGQAVLILIDGTTHFTNTPYLRIIESLGEFGEYSDTFDLLTIQQGAILLKDESRTTHLGAYVYGQVAGHVKGNQEIN